MILPDILKQIAQKIDKEGGTPILVGGAVRDHLLGQESKDFDVEVFNLHTHQLLGILKKYGNVSAVGKAFGVLKLSSSGYHFDFSLPRNDLKTGAGHRGFHITTDPEMTFRSAASRRDFTINSLGYNITSGEILDEFGGRSDLNRGILRVVDPSTFIEDPLRVLRGIQFAARFNLHVPQATREIMTNLIETLEELPRERIFKEIQKLLLKAERPSLGLSVADETGIIKKLFPELNALHTITRDPDWYPQSDSWSHTLRTLDEAALLRVDNPYEDTALLLAALCHEFTLLNAAEFIDEKWKRHHQAAPLPSVTKSFLNRMTNEIKLIDTVDKLVSEHRLLMRQLRSTQLKNGDVRRLSLKVDIPLLLRLARADFFAGFAENEKPATFPAGDWLMERYHALKLDNSKNLQPMLLGRHLISLGLKPGPFFGKILTEAYQKQLDDEFITLEDAIDWARMKIESMTDSRSKPPGA